MRLRHAHARQSHRGCRRGGARARRRRDRMDRARRRAPGDLLRGARRRSAHYARRVRPRRLRVGPHRAAVPRLASGARARRLVPRLGDHPRAGRRAGRPARGPLRGHAGRAHATRDPRAPPPRLERRTVRCGDPLVRAEPAALRGRRGPGGRWRQLRGRAHHAAHRRGRAGRGARVRGGRERAEAHRARRLQPRQRPGSRGAAPHMIPSFRWFGAADPIPLAHIRQIPGVTGIVSALYDVPVGDTWSRARLGALKAQVEDAGLRFAVVESVPVHEDIKLGRPGRDRLIDNYCASVASMGELRIPVLCYNFMPVFDWTRTDLAMRLPDGSTALAYDDRALAAIDLSRGTGELPGWATAYSPPELQPLLAAYHHVDAEQLWDNLGYFLERVAPAAEQAGVRLALHPDDPPWPIFGLPRIITNARALERLVALVDSPANGVTFCTGSLGASPENDLPAMVRRLGERIHFSHCRNVRITGERRFHETAHPSPCGSVDLFEVLRALRDVGFAGPMRPDHGRMIWGETGRPGYGLYDRALGVTYLQGLWEALSRMDA